MNDPNSRTKLQTIIDSLAMSVREGMTTMELEDSAVRLLSLLKVEPAFKGYQPHGAKGGYPFVSCISIDNEVIHGLPSDRKIEEGQMVKIDLGLIDDGQYDDGATTVLVGHCSATARRLWAATSAALEVGIAAAKAGNTTHDIGRAISAVAKDCGFGIIKGYGGHGIGTKLHEEPNVPNEVEGNPVELKPGMRICVEPMFASNKGYVYIDPNGWTIKLHGGGVAAHFERSVTIK